MKAKRGKCLALVAVLAMVVCAFAVALPAGDSDADTGTATATKASDSASLNETAGNYYIAEGGKITGITGASGIYNIYLLHGADIVFEEISSGATFNLYFASAVDTSKKTDNVTYDKGLKLVGIGDQMYTADAKDTTDNKVADRIVTGAVAGTDSVYGVLISDGTTTYSYYPEKTDAGNVDFSGSGSFVSILNGSAKVNAVYETGSGTSAKTVTTETITATDIKSETNVVIELTTAPTLSGTAAVMTVSGGNDVENGVPTTAGSITVDKSGTTTYYAVSADNAAKLAKVLNGFFVDDSTSYMYQAVAAAASGNNGDAGKVAAVYGSVSTTAALTGNTVDFYYAKATGIMLGTTNTVSVSGNAEFKDGKLLFSDGIEGQVVLIAGSFTLGDDTGYGQDIIVNSGVTLTLEDTQTEDGYNTNIAGKLYLYGKLTATQAAGETLTVQGADGKTAELRAYSGSEITDKVTVEEGTYCVVDLSGAMKYVYLEGKESVVRDIAQTQVVTVRGSYELTGEDSGITIHGTLIVPVGTELIISKGAAISVVGALANVLIYGALTIEDEGSEFTVTDAEEVDVSGLITAGENTKLNVESEKFVVKSGAIVDTDGDFDANVMTVNAGGIVYVTGTATMTNLYNAGTVGLDGVTINGKSTIHLTAAGAAVAMNEVAIGTAWFVVDDDRLGTDGTAIGEANDITMAATKGTLKVSGLTLTAAGSKGTTDTRAIDMCGNVSAERTAGNGKLVIAAMGTGLTVKDTLVLPAETMFSLYNSAKLTVSGALAAASGVVLDGAATIDVTGEVCVAGAKLGTTELKINAVYYQSADTSDNYPYVYTTMAAAIESESAAIEVLGTVTMKESATIPDGMTVKVGAGCVLNVGTSADTSTRSVVLAFEDGAKASGEGSVYVYGSVAVENVKDYRLADRTYSDVTVSDSVSATYTNIYTAMENAEAGDIVTVTKTTAVELDADMTIGEGVTLYVPSGKTITVTGSKVTVTVNGALVTATGIENFDKKTTTLKVAGEFLTGEVDLPADLFGKYNFAGAYYQITDSAGTYVHITTLENAVEDAQDALTINICGAVTVGDIGLTGAGPETEDVVSIIVIPGASLTAGTISLSNAAVGGGEKAAVTATFEGLNGSIAVKNIGNFGVEVIEDEAGVEEMYIAGDFVTASSSTESSIAVVSGTVTAIDDIFTSFDVTAVDSFTVSENATLEIEGGSTMDAETISVAGTLAVDNKAVLNAEKVYVTGTLTVYAAESGSTAGSVDADALFVGIAASSTGAAAAVSAPGGSVDAGVIYVMAGSTVSDGVVKDMKHTAYYVEGKERFTVYVPSASTMEIGDIDSSFDVTIAGAKVTGWEKEDDVIGSVEKVEAVVNYKVFAISFLADYGFADIYLDGAKVATVSGGQVVYIDPAVVSGDEQKYILVEDGAHTLKYTLKSGYSGDKVTTAFNGKAFTETFTIDTTLPFEDSSESAIVYKIVMSGVTQSEPIVPEQEKKDTVLTDALLIVLVVLIAIMAIMVALRLMRS